MDLDLTPRYDSRKSFYGKAIVRVYDDGTRKLFSYHTSVASIYPNGFFRVKGWFSATTARHINEFLQQNGLSKMTKAQMDGHYEVREQW